MREMKLTIYSIIGVLFIAFLFFYTLLNSNIVFWDEAYYLDNLRLFKEYGFTIEYLVNYKGPAGPTYSMVHYIFEGITNLKAPLVRMVNLFLLLGILYYIYKAFLKLDFSVFKSFVFAISSMAIPTIYTISGMALTEIPAIFFLTVFVYLTIDLYINNSFKVISSIFAGLFLSLAILGRQPILLILLAFPLFFIRFERKIIIEKRKDKFLKSIVIIFFTSLIMPIIVFFIWGNLQPKSEAYTGVGLSINNLILALGYMAIFTLFVNPDFFKSLNFYSKIKELISIIILSIVINFVFLKISFTPLNSIVKRMFSEGVIEIYSLFIGSMLSVLGIAFLYLYIKKQLQEKNQLKIFLSIAFLLVVVSSIKITHQFSARYVVQAFPLLILSSFDKDSIITWKSIVGIVLGGLIGMISLNSYFN